MSYENRAKNYIEALGGIDNIKAIDNCVTRLHLDIVDMNKIDDDALIKAGSKGTIYVGDNKFQLIVGSCVVLIANEMHKLKGDGEVSKEPKAPVDYHQTAKDYIKGLGGIDNILMIDNCITRLRIKLKDINKSDETVLSEMDNKGVIRKSKNKLQIVIGLTVNNIADEMRDICNNA